MRAARPHDPLPPSDRPIQSPSPRDSFHPHQARPAWQAIESHYFQTAGQLTKQSGTDGFGSALCEMPTSLPWVATVLLPPLMALSKSDAGFIGHIGICIAQLLAEE